MAPKDYILPDIIVEHIIGKTSSQLIGPKSELDKTTKGISRILWDDTIQQIQKKIFISNEELPPEWQSLYVYDPLTNHKIFLNDTNAKVSDKKYLFEFTYNGKIKDNIIYVESLDDHIDNLSKVDQDCLLKNCKSRSAGKLNDIIELRERWADIKMDQIRSLIAYVLKGDIDDYIRKTVDPNEEEDEGSERFVQAENQLVPIETRLKDYPRNSVSDPLVQKLFEFSENDTFHVLRATVTINMNNPKTPVDLHTIYNRIELDSRIPFVATNFFIDGKKTPYYKLWNGLKNIDDANMQKEISDWIIKDGVELRNVSQIVFRVKDTNSKHLKYLGVTINQSGVVTLRCSWNREEKAVEEDLFQCMKLVNGLIDKVNTINKFSDLENPHNIPKASFNNSSITSIDGQMVIMTLLDNEHIFKMLGNDNNPLSFFAYRTSRTKDTITYRRGNSSILIRGGGLNSMTVKIDAMKNIQHLYIINDFVIALTKIYIQEYGRSKVESVTLKKKEKSPYILTRICQPKIRKPVIDNDYKYPLAKDSYDIIWPAEGGDRYICPPLSEEELKTKSKTDIGRWRNTPFVFPGFQRDRQTGKIGICCFGTLGESGTKGSTFWQTAKKSIVARTLTTQKHLLENRTGILPGEFISNYLLILFSDLIKEITKKEQEKSKGKKLKIDVQLLRFGVLKGDFFNAVYEAIRSKKNKNDEIKSGDDLRKKITSDLTFTRFKSLEGGNFLSSGTGSRNKLDLLEKKITNPEERGKEELKAYKKYIDLLSSDIQLDHIFIWDLTTRFIKHNIYVFDEELNTMMCPEVDDIFDKNYPSIILIKKRGMPPTYEPVFLMDDKSKTIPKRSYYRNFDADSHISKELYKALEFICKKDRAPSTASPEEMITAKQLESKSKKIGSKEFIGQIVNSYNKSTYLVHKSGVLVPVRHSGPLEDLPIYNIENYKLDANKSKMLLSKVPKELNIDNLLGITAQVKIEKSDELENKKNPGLTGKIIALLTESGLTLPVKKSPVIDNLPIVNLNIFDGLDKALFEGTQEEGIRIITVRKRIYDEEVLQRLRLEISYYLNNSEHNNIKSNILEILSIGLPREGKVKLLQPIVSKIVNSIFYGTDDPYDAYRKIPQKRKVCHKLATNDLCNSDPFCNWSSSRTDKCQLAISNDFINDAISYIIDDLLRDKRKEILNNQVSEEISERGKPIIRPSETIITTFEQAIEWLNRNIK